MFQKLEYTDLNRFLVSIGLLMIVFAIIMQWLFLRENFDLLITVEELAKLTEDSKTIIESRQNNLIRIIRVSPWISLVFAVVGLLSMVIGIVRWYRKQNLLDERDSLTNEKMKNELAAMTQKQIEEKVAREVEQVHEGTGDLVNRNTLINEYLSIEKMVTQVVNGTFFNEYEILPNYSLKHSDSEIDIILKPRIISKDTSPYHILIEIKYFSENRLRKNILSKSTQQLNWTMNSYMHNVSISKVAGVVLIIADDEDFERYDGYQEEVIKKNKMSNPIAWVQVSKDNIEGIVPGLRNFIESLK